MGRVLRAHQGSGRLNPLRHRHGSFPGTSVLARKGRSFVALRPCRLRAAALTGRRDGGSGDQAQLTLPADGDVQGHTKPTWRSSLAQGRVRATFSASGSPTSTTCLSALVTAV